MLILFHLQRVSVNELYELRGCMLWRERLNHNPDVTFVFDTVNAPYELAAPRLYEAASSEFLNPLMSASLNRTPTGS